MMLRSGLEPHEEAREPPSGGTHTPQIGSACPAAAAAGMGRALDGSQQSSCWMPSLAHLEHSGAWRRGVPFIAGPPRASQPQRWAILRRLSSRVKKGLARPSAASISCTNVFHRTPSCRVTPSWKEHTQLYRCVGGTHGVPRVGRVRILDGVLAQILSSGDATDRPMRCAGLDAVLHAFGHQDPFGEPFGCGAWLSQVSTTSRCIVVVHDLRGYLHQL